MYLPCMTPYENGVAKDGNAAEHPMSSPPDPIPAIGVGSTISLVQYHDQWAGARDLCRGCRPDHLVACRPSPITVRADVTPQALASCDVEQATRSCLRTAAIQGSGLEAESHFCCRTLNSPARFICPARRQCIEDTRRRWASVVLAIPDTLREWRGER